MPSAFAALCSMQCRAANENLELASYVGVAAVVVVLFIIANSLVISFSSKPIKIITIIHHMHFAVVSHYINMCAHDASFEFYTRLSFRSN